MTVEQSTEGLTTNPYRIIQATDKIGRDADVLIIQMPLLDW